MRYCFVFASLLVSCFLAVPLAAQWQPAGPYGTHVLHIAPNSRFVYAGTKSTGGVYRSEDGGLTWERGANRGLVTDRDSLGPWVSAVAATDVSVIADLNDGGFNAFFRSRDHGATWTKVSTLPTAGVYTAAGVRWIGFGGDSLVAHQVYNSSSYVSRIHVSTDGGDTWTQRADDLSRTILRVGKTLVSTYATQFAQGVLVSEDFGQTWTQRPHPTVTGGTPSLTLSLTAGDGRLAFVHSGTLYLSADIGQTWTTHNLPRFVDDKNFAYNGLAMGGGTILLYGHYGFQGTAVGRPAGFVSTDEGTTWTPIPDPPLSFAYAETTTGDKAIPMVHTGQRFLHGSIATGLISSTDGVTWRGAGPMGLAQAPWQGSVLTAAAVFQDRLFANMTSPLLRTADGGATWRYASASTRGFFDLLARGDSVLLGATSQGLYASADGGTTWTTRTATGHRTWLREGPSGRLYSARVGSTSPDKMNYSDDGGRTWTGITTFPGTVRAFDVGGGHLIASGPNSSVGRYVYVSSDAGATWTQAPDSVRAETVAASATALFASRPDAQYIGGTTWDYSEPIHRSRDGGATWERINGPIAAGAALLRTQGTMLLAAAPEFVAVSTDDGTTWRLPPTTILQDLGLVYTPTHLLVHRDTVYVGLTAGSRPAGFYKRALTDFTAIPTAAEADDRVAGPTVTVAPNPVRGAARVTVTMPQRSNTRVAVYDVLGREVARMHDGPLAAGETALVWNGDAPAGLYLVRVDAEGTTRTVRLVRAER